MEQTRKKTCVERDKDSDKDKNTRDPDNTLKSWEALTYDVLCVIFKYLNGLDLSNASKVCRTWLEAANSEKRTRGPMCLTRNIKEMGYVVSGWEDIKTESIRYSSVKPSLALFFTTIGLEGSLSQRCHCDFLPPNCDSVSLDTYGVVINNTETGEDSENIVCMFLPEVSNIEISTLALNLDDWEETLSAYCKQVKATHEASSDSDCHKESCLMLFCEWDGRTIAVELLKSLKRWFPKTKPCIWGGIAKDISLCNSVNNTRVCRNSANCIAVVLSGTKMKTWSVLLDANCNTKEKVEDELRAFRDSVQLKKHSVGFMFACCIRGVNMFNENNVESIIFKRFFPKVPLVGCFGDGEFGKRILNETSRKKRIKCISAWVIPREDKVVKSGPRKGILTLVMIQWFT
ncbi:hypothetical protein KPH14_008469 [Odynerus spinipes]|uniref:F-box domain-containing protein n=1 Tax=Odynerus spinipes TaxID=1348599 RepID=A0AAD9RE73_9HYME|nr:hypothetical protein KPH14_008469 [Odynerus spinipes]